MRKITLIISLLVFANCIQAQYTAIPDEMFEKALIELGYDYGAVDGKVLTSNIDTITQLEVAWEGISSLEGINDFTSLKELDCSYNSLTSLDVSSFPQITYLKCSRNDIGVLDVSNCINLSFLECHQTGISSLNLSNCTNISNLGCVYNDLAELDVSNCSKLSVLNCHGNNLSSLDLSSNIELVHLSCDGNNLSSLDLSNCNNIEQLYCSNNNLDTLDLSDNYKLTNLDCNDNNMSSLFFSDSSQIMIIECMRNNLTKLDFSKCSQLNYVECNDNKLTSLDISNCGDFYYLECNDNDLTSLNLSNSNNFSFFSCYNNPDLFCVIVDDTSYFNNEWSYSIEPWMHYSEKGCVYEHQDICMVTCDSTTQKNKIIWEKPLDEGIASFNIWKESGSAGNYINIGNVLFDSESTFIDDRSDPETFSHKYKISVVDTLSQESDLSDFHRTMQLTASPNIGGGNNLIWTDYMINSTDYADSYTVYRGSSFSNFTAIYTGVLPSGTGVTTMLDNGSKFASNYYKIGYILQDPCNPSKSTPVEVFSNIVEVIINDVENVKQSNEFAIYPNPTNDYIFFEGSDNRFNQVKIFDIKGSLLIDQQLPKDNRINVEALSKGVYFIKFGDSEGESYSFKMMKK